MHLIHQQKLKIAFLFDLHIIGILMKCIVNFLNCIFLLINCIFLWMWLKNLYLKNKTSQIISNFKKSRVLKWKNYQEIFILKREVAIVLHWIWQVYSNLKK